MKTYNAVVLMHGCEYESNRHASRNNCPCEGLQLVLHDESKGSRFFDYFNPCSTTVMRDPTTTAFLGNLHSHLLVTAASNSFKTYYPSARLDKDGRTIYEGFDYDILNLLAREMNFTTEWHEPESPSNFGSLTNGTWNGIIGKSRLHIYSVSMTHISHRSMKGYVADPRAVFLG